MPNQAMPRRYAATWARTMDLTRPSAITREHMPIRSSAITRRFVRRRAPAVFRSRPCRRSSSRRYDEQAHGSRTGQRPIPNRIEVATWPTKHAPNDCDACWNRMFWRRCRKGVDPISYGSSKFIAIDEQPNDQIVHVLRLGQTDGAAHQPFDPGPHEFILIYGSRCLRGT